MRLEYVCAKLGFGVQATHGGDDILLMTCDRNTSGSGIKGVKGE
jgi:hypothetical protein